MTQYSWIPDTDGISQTNVSISFKCLIDHIDQYLVQHTSKFKPHKPIPVHTATFLALDLILYKSKLIFFSLNPKSELKKAD